MTRVARSLRTRGVKGALSLAALVVTVLAVAVSGVGATKDSQPHSTPPLATQTLSEGSSCGGTTSFFRQSLDGEFTGCFRVPDLHTSSLVVALQAYVVTPSSSTNLTTTTPPAPARDAIVSLTLSTKVVVPGQHVALTGHLATPLAVSLRPAYVTLCWDGCASGLHEVAVPVVWTSSATFQAPLTVPATAWLSLHDATVSVHPLVSGAYQVGIECFGPTSGCSLGADQATTTVELTAPSAPRCVAGQPCETMTLHPANAAVGDLVQISGWAPVQSIIGQPTSYMLSVTPAGLATTYPAFAVGAQPTSGAYDVVLSPHVLQVTPSPTWSSLGRVGYLTSSFAGPVAVQPESGSNLVAWCPTSGLVLSADSSRRLVSTAGVAIALRGTSLSLALPSSPQPPCTTALADPRHGASVYASFATELDHSAPPLVYAGLFTTNDGLSWRLVPVPAGMSIEDFGGFVTGADGVDAMFIDPSNVGNSSPSGTRAGRVVTEVTTNGGASWSTSTLGCPSVGPCTTFGPYQWGHCAMHAAPQYLLQGNTGSHGGSGVTWTTTLWSQTVDGCHSPELAVTSSHSLLLVDPSAQYPLLRSTNAGVSWTPVAIPLVKEGGFSTTLAQWGYPLMFAPDGSLLTVVTDATGPYQGVFRLAPGSTTWCHVRHLLGAIASQGVAGPFAFHGHDLVWVRTSHPDSPQATSALVVTPLADLRC